jgi:hypothetical protein
MHANACAHICRCFAPWYQQLKKHHAIETAQPNLQNP